MRHRTTAVRTAVLALAAALLCGAASAPPARADDRGTTDLRLLLTASGRMPTAAALQRASPSLDGARIRVIGDGVALLTGEVPAGRAAATVDAIERLPGVASVSIDRRTSLVGTRAPVRPADAYFGEQWDLWDAAATKRAGGYGVDAARAWTRTLGTPETVVAVLDTGLTAHPDLAGASVLPGYDFVSGEAGVATGDGDGWDADPADPGDVCGETGDPSSWHGTFVTGEIVAQHGDGGLAGGAPGASVLPVRVLGGCGGTEADTIAAIGWASGGVVPGVPDNPSPADVVSLSLGAAHRACPAAVQTAIDDARARGSVVVAAAGNEGDPVAGSSPANCVGVVSVVATTRAGDLAAYSNRGDGALAPTIAAPGGSDADPVLGDSWSSTGAFTDAGNAATIAAAEGTSMAAPRVTAAIALLRSVQPDLTPDQVVERLVRTATAFPKGSSCTPTRCGAGVVNAGNLVGAERRFVHATRTRAEGRAVVGRRLTADPGRWRAQPETVRYRWYRDGRAIASATGRTYRLRPVDRGHRVTVRVEVQRRGTVAAHATSPARRVR